MVTYDQFNVSLLKNKTIWMVEGKKTIQYLFQNIKINDINIYSTARKYIEYSNIVYSNSI